MTPEQKEKNQKYILDNLDKYILDGKGNFVHIDSDLMGSENAELYFIGKEAVSNYEELLEAVEKSILQNKEDWKVVSEANTIYYKNIKDERVIYQSAFGFERGYLITGGLGYRENIWKYYEERKRQKEEWEKWYRENITSNSNNPQSTPPNPEQDKQNSTSPSNNSSLQTPNPKKGNSSSNQPNEKKDNSENKSTETENKPTVPKPTTNTQTNNSNTKEEKTNTKNQINQLLEKNNLKISDLPKKYQNWEKELEKLDSKEKIDAFVQQLEQTIKQQIDNKSKKISLPSNKEKSSVFWLISGGVILSVFLLAFLFFWKRKKKIHWSKNFKG